MAKRILLVDDSASVRTVAGAAGAKAWITKPFQPAVMLDAVSKLVMA